MIQCGRHNDIFKFWLAWRGKGTAGFELQMDRIMELASYQVRRMQELSDRFLLIQQTPEMVNVCFWYIPERLRETPHDEQRISELGKVTAELKTRMMYSGNLMVSYQPLDDKPNFFRSIISNQGKAMMILNKIFKNLIFDIKPARRRTLTSCWRSSTDSALICKIFQFTFIIYLSCRY